MEPFNRLRGIAAPLRRDDIDTDAVIPVPWMKSTTPDYRRALFANWRFENGDGVTEIPSFVLNRVPFRDAAVLVAGSNFGCGSSREAAVWALHGFGIRCVIAPSFSDIFFENCFKNGFLPLALPGEEVGRLLQLLEAGEQGHVVEVDLPTQIVTYPGGRAVPFAIDSGRKAGLLSGLDEIGRTLAHESAIDAFVTRDRELRPWIYDPPLNAGPAR
jgi:3-isopropylmalate/(R)-2-methylmalate dehydratase small subunit